MGGLDLGKLPGVILILFMLAVLIGISALTLTSLREQSVPTVTTTNDTFTALNNTNVSLDYGYIGSTSSCFNMSNTSQLVAGANYTIYSNGAGYFNLHESSVKFNATTVGCTYNRQQYENIIVTAQNETIAAIGEFGSWVGIIVLMIIVSVILGLVYMFQMSRR